jgi:hypothetical protein
VQLGFNAALMEAVDVALAMFCDASIEALGMEWKSVKKGEGEGRTKQKFRKVAGRRRIIGIDYELWALLG